MATKRPAPFKFTKTRAKWAEQRAAAPVFKGTVLANNAAVSSRYVRRLSSLLAQMTAQTNREIRRLFESEAAAEYFAQDSRSVASEARILINSLQRRFLDMFAKRAKAVAESMVKDAEKASASAVHTSMEKLSGGMSLKASGITPKLSNIYKASVAENVSLIKSIPQEYLNDVQGAVMRSITSGNGLQDLLPALQKYEGIAHRRAKNIAMDQTRKAYNSINKGRMEAVGIRRFEWMHSGGSDKPRQDHIEMSGKIFSFDDLPVIDQRTGERGIPGQAVNCRCTMRPVFDFSDTQTETEE